MNKALTAISSIIFASSILNAVSGQLNASDTQCATSSSAPAGRGIDWFKNVDRNGSSKSEPKVVINGTRLAQKILDTIRTQITAIGLNSLPLPPLSVEFEGNTTGLTNGSINGIFDIHSVGDTLVTIRLGSTVFSTAFGWPNSSIKTDVDVQTSLEKAGTPHHGIVSGVLQNITVVAGIKLDHLTQTLTLDTFAVSLDSISVGVNGLGQNLDKGSQMASHIMNRLKDPVLFVFNIVFKILFNAALQVARVALQAG